MAKQQVQGPSPESLKAGYDLSGVNTRGLVWFLAIFVVTAIVVHVFIYFLFEGYKAQDAKYQTQASALENVAQPVPPEPRLQPNVYDEVKRTPEADLKQMYIGEDEAFRQMGWEVDAATHVITVPTELIARVVQEETQRQSEPPTTQPAGPSGSPDRVSRPGDSAGTAR